MIAIHYGIITQLCNSMELPPSAVAELNCNSILIIVFSLCLYFSGFKKSLEHLPSVLFKSIASKSRAEAFSDGVFAIVATLIVLDLT